MTQATGQGPTWGAARSQQESSWRPGASECLCTCALFRDSYRRGGLARQIVIYVLLTADLSVLPFESRMTVHSDSLRSLERMTLSRMAGPADAQEPGPRAGL